MRGNPEFDSPHSDRKKGGRIKRKRGTKRWCEKWMEKEGHTGRQGTEIVERDQTEQIMLKTKRQDKAKPRVRGIHRRTVEGAV